MDSLEIKSVKIREQYPVIEHFLDLLHQNEKRLFDKTALWNDIKENYMSHVIEMQEDNEGLCLMAIINDIPVGFIFGYLEIPDESRIEIFTGKELYVSDGFVLPEYRRKGIYKKLNEVLEQYYIEKGIKRLMRFTMYNNINMRHFLEKEGYSATRVLYEKWLI